MIGNRLLNSCLSTKLYSDRLKQYLGKDILFHECSFPWPKKAMKSLPGKLVRILSLLERLLFIPLILKYKSEQYKLTHVMDHYFAYLHRYINSEYAIVICHDLTPLMYPEQCFSSGLLPGLSQTIWKKSIKNLEKYDKVICVSQTTMKDVNKYLNIPVEKCCQIYNPLDELYRSAYMNRKANTFDANRNFRMLHVGTNEYRKNIKGLLKAMNICIYKYKINIELHKAGEYFNKELKKLICEYNLEDKIIEHGFLSNEDYFHCIFRVIYSVILHFMKVSAGLLSKLWPAVFL